MCDCIKEIQDNIKNDITKNEKYSKLEIKSVECGNTACIIEENKLVARLAILFTVHHQQIGRKKNTTINMVAKYCPFCGKAY